MPYIRKGRHIYSEPQVKPFQNKVKLFIAAFHRETLSYKKIKADAPGVSAKYNQQMSNRRLR